MTSTTAVQNEIERFLRSPEPEVLCITGDWGVGKTYNWQVKLDQMRTNRAVGLARYSYVSLFGINSLEGLKQSIFENLKFIVPEGQTGYDRMVSGANRTFQQGKRLVQAASAIPIAGDALAKISQPFLFSSIFNQIICIDDLERRGDNLTIKDVFGLISYLREQKSCKIVLLLNEAKLEQVEYKEYFEKVIDAKIVFSPTPPEAAAIAFPSDDILSKLVREYSVRLGIKNIRVMKKIERLVRIAVSAIPEMSDEIRRQTVQSLVIFGWCKFDSGSNPPPLEYLGEGSLARAVERQTSNTKASEDEKRWDAIRTRYDFGYADDFDLDLMKFVDTSVIDIDEIVLEAGKQEAALQRNKQSGSFESAFRPLHDSFLDNEDEVCNAMISGVKDNLEVVSLANFDAVVSTLERLGRTAMVAELIDFVVKEAPSDYWLNDDPFRRVIKSERLKKIIAERREVAKPALNFERDLVESAQNFNKEKIAELADVSQESYLKLFESKKGEELRRIVLAALAFRQIGNATPQMKEIVEKAEGALRAIGKRSALQALRMENFGVSLSTTLDVESEEGAA
jgi:hypothetical protein